MKILVAEDDVVSSRMLKSTLESWGYEVLITKSGDEALETLKGEDPPHLAILDWMMPGLSGPEVCRQIRISRQEPYIYILLLTARDSKEDIVEGLKSGADDYVTKPFHAHELDFRLRTGKRIISLQGELIEARENQRKMALRDPLTGLFNRRAIFEELSRELDRSRRSGETVALLMTDIDHFKKINDTSGHLAGDSVLRQVADRMLHALRSYDAIGRYGGEEFLVIVKDCNLENARRQGERLRLGVWDRPVHVDKLDIRVSMSVGVVSSENRSDFKPEQLIALADEALYSAKSKGRNRVEMYPASLLRQINRSS